MKKILFALLFVSTQAQAGTWNLINDDYVIGTGHICTYQLQGSNYVATIISQSFCRMFIFQ